MEQTKGILRHDADSGCLIDEQNRMIADLGFAGINSVEWAQRIVIAVNNFDALLDACKMARDTLDSNCDCNEPEDLDSAFQACFEAVANAECESK